MCSFKQRLRLGSFMRALFPDPSMARRATEIAHAMIKACSLRMSDLASNLDGSYPAAYKRIWRFLKVFHPHALLWKRLPEDAPFALMHITKIPRPQAHRTE